MHKYVKKWLYEKNPNVPVIVAGDLDIQPNNMLISKLMESMFVDLGNLANPQGPKYSLQTQQIPNPKDAGYSQKTVDYIFVLKHYTDENLNKSEADKKGDLNVDKS